MNKYMPTTSEFQIIKFEDSPLKENLNTYAYFPKEHKLFIPIGMIKTKGFLIASFDNIPMVSLEEYDTSFISADWVIDNNFFGDTELTDGLKRFLERLKSGEANKK